MIIIDEAHNFFRAITNGGKNALGLYDMIMSARDLTLIFLTGTPIAHDPFEIVPCFNMLGAVGEVVLPENYTDFYKMFVDKKLGIIKNKGKFQNRIMGLVSYVSQLSTPGKALGVSDTDGKAEFPSELPMIIERVHMDVDQYTMYKLARDKEQDEGTGKQYAPRSVPALTKPRSGASSSYRVRSRQLGNFCPPPGMRDEKDPAKIPVELLGSAKFRAIMKNVSLHPNQIGLVYSQFTGIGGLGSFARYLESLGWVQYKCPPRGGVNTNNDLGSEPGDGPEVPSVDEYLNNIEHELANGGSGIIGGDFNLSDGYPLNLIGGCCGDNYDDSDDNLNDNGENNLSDYLPTTGGWWASDGDGPAVIGGDFNLADGYHLGQGDGSDNKPKTYALITGDVSVEDRAYIQEVSNQPDNAHGGIIDLILVSSTGAEGLDFKNGRNVHVMEMYWDWARVMQVVKRFVRNNSHIGLPENERNVTPYLYLAIPPESERDTQGVYPETTDVELFNSAISSQVLNDSFIEAIAEVSIECMINAGAHCRTCNPTGEPLYTNDLDRDMLAVDPCQTYEEKQIRAESITIDGITYHFVPDIDSVYDYAIYTFDDEVNKHRRMKECDPRYEKIIESVLSLINKSGGSQFVIEEHTNSCVDLGNNDSNNLGDSSVNNLSDNLNITDLFVDLEPVQSDPLTVSQAM